MQLRAYQLGQKQTITGWLKDPKTVNKSTLVVSPVASGKSLLIAIAAASTEGGALVLQPSVELLEQNVEKLDKLYGIKASVYSASANRKELGNLIFATLKSLDGMGNQLRQLGIRTLIIDEADRSYKPEQWKTKTKSVDVVKQVMGVSVKMKETKTERVKETSEFSRFLNDFKPLRMLGFTATPFRIKKEKRGVSLHMLTNFGVWDDIVYIEQVATMTEGKYWAPVKYTCYDFDEGLLRYGSAGEFTEESIQAANMAMNVNRNMYLDIQKLKENPVNKLLVCCESVEVAEKMGKYVAGSKVVTGKTPKKERKQIIADFRDGKFQVLINVAALLIGYDEPGLTHVLIGRPTGSFSLYYQIVGRGVRLHPNGLPVEIRDYCGNVKRFGPIEEMVIHKHPTYGFIATVSGKVITGVTVGSKVTYDEYLAKKGKVQKECDMVMPFGKHKNKRVDSIPAHMLKWYVSGKCEFIESYPHVKEAIINYLN